LGGGRAKNRKGATKEGKMRRGKKGLGDGDKVQGVHPKRKEGVAKEIQQQRGGEKKGTPVGITLRNEKDHVLERTERGITWEGEQSVQGLTNPPYLRK